MGASTEYYVDPSIAGDSGTGTIGDPYGDLQYALNTVTRDATNGDRFNIKAGTDEILASALTLATYGSPAPSSAPLTLRGYTTTAGDGGIGGISGNGSNPIFTSAAYDNINLIDLHMHNAGGASLILLDNNIHIANCEIDNAGGAGVQVGQGSTIVGCYIHNVRLNVLVETDSLVAMNYCLSGPTNNFGSNGVLDSAGTTCTFYGNIISVGPEFSGAAIKFRGNYCSAINNSIYAPSSTGVGIQAWGGFNHVILNNVIHGFNGTGGIGIDVDASACIIHQFGGNSVRNATTIQNTIGDKIYKNWAATETLSSDPFTDPANGDFTPLDVGSLKDGSVPTSWKGL